MILAGRLTLWALGLIVATVLIAVAARATWPPDLGRADWTILRFTLLQALLSTLISTLLAIPLARALARRRFLGRSLVITFLGAPFLLPVIVAVFGLLAVWGRSGWISAAIAPTGLPPLDIYGLTGVVLAHVFFNLPLATRLILFGWGAIPAGHYRLADGLGLSPWRRFTLMEAPMLREVLPGAALLIFILCVTSFAVVLTLGGGPAATSLEVAIFAAIRFEFDLSRAALLALMELAICLVAALVLLRVGRPPDAAPDTQIQWYGNIFDGSPALVWQDRIVIAVGILFLFTPLCAIALRGSSALIAGLPAETWPALRLSLTIAALSAFLAVSGALLVAYAVLAGAGRAGEAVAAMPLIVSPFVLGTGLFIILNPVVDPFALSLPVTAFVNAALSLPFCLRLILPPLARIRRDYGRLGDALGMTGWSRIRTITWPGIKAPLGFATGLALALSMGDLGVIALFSPVDSATLPLLMYRLMGAYRMEEAAGVALILIAASFAVFALAERGGRLGARL